MWVQASQDLFAEAIATPLPVEDNEHESGRRSESLSSARGEKAHPPNHQRCTPAQHLPLATPRSLSLTMLAKLGHGRSFMQAAAIFPLSFGFFILQL